MLALSLLAAACGKESLSPSPHTGPNRKGPPPAAVAPAPVMRLGLVTFNVLADPVFSKQRVPALLRLLKSPRADLIALQEVAPWFQRALLAQPWVAKRYNVTRRQGKPFAPGGQLDDSDP